MGQKPREPAKTKKKVKSPPVEEVNPGDPPAMPRERERVDPWEDPRIPPQKRPEIGSG